MFIEKEIYFKDIHEKIQHLSKDKVVELINGYYHGVNITGLIERYEIEVRNSNLINIFPKVIVNEECKHCNGLIVAGLQSRTSKNPIKMTSARCVECKHYQFYHCDCHSCKKEYKLELLDRAREKRKEMQIKQTKINEALDDTRWRQVKEEEINLVEKLYLNVLIRASASLNKREIKPLRTMRGELAPFKLEREMIDTLLKKEIIVLSKTQGLENYEVRYEGDEGKRVTLLYDEYNSYFRINIKSKDGSYTNMLNRLTNLKTVEFEEGFCYEMWRQIALHNCKQYFYYYIKHLDNSYINSERVDGFLTSLLQAFSVSQIYGIIYSSIAKSTLRYQSGEITKQHAINAVIVSCEQYGERAVAKGWKLQHFDRISQMPQTVIEKILFNDLMGIGENSFYCKPILNWSKYKNK